MTRQRENDESTDSPALQADLGLATLEEARKDLAAGVREVGGHNLGPAIVEYARPFGLRPPINWCAVALAAWVRRAAARLGLYEPPVGSPGAQATMGQFRSLGLWTPASAARSDPRALLPGNVVVWWRDPERAWMGHIGIIDQVVVCEEGGIMLEVIEGNSGPLGDRVARMDRDLDDRRLLGIGRLRTTEDPAPDTLTELELREAFRLMRLSHEVSTFQGLDPMAVVEQLIEETKKS